MHVETTGWSKRYIMVQIKPTLIGLITKLESVGFIYIYIYIYEFGQKESYYSNGKVEVRKVWYWEENVGKL